jgi:hypothetical protein
MTEVQESSHAGRGLYCASRAVDKTVVAAGLPREDALVLAAFRRSQELGRINNSGIATET